MARRMTVTPEAAAMIRYSMRGAGPIFRSDWIATLEMVARGATITPEIVEAAVQDTSMRCYSVLLPEPEKKPVQEFQGVSTGFMWSRDRYSERERQEEKNV